MLVNFVCLVDFYHVRSVERTMHNGVRVYESAIRVTPRDLRGCVRGMKFQTIFNPDKKRSQARLGKASPIVKRVARWLAHEGLLKGGRTVGTCSVVRSKAGCARQQWHYDYDPRALASTDVKPLGVIVALQNNTSFHVHPDMTHTLSAGDVIVFDGDVQHAGAGYACDNHRVHMYVDAPGVTRVQNETYY